MSEQARDTGGLREALEIASELIDASAAWDECRHGQDIWECTEFDESEEGCADRSRREFIRAALASQGAAHEERACQHTNLANDGRFCLNCRTTLGAAHEERGLDALQEALIDEGLLRHGTPEDADGGALIEAYNAQVTERLFRAVVLLPPSFRLATPETARPLNLGELPGDPEHDGSATPEAAPEEGTT